MLVQKDVSVTYEVFGKSMQNNTTQLNTFTAQNLLSKHYTCNNLDDT